MRAPAAPASKAFPDLPALAKHLREELQARKFVLLYAYNGTGKTRLCTEFKDLGKQGEQRVRAVPVASRRADRRNQPRFPLRSISTNA